MGKQVPTHERQQADERDGGAFATHDPERSPFHATEATARVGRARIVGPRAGSDGDDRPGGVGGPNT